MNPVLAVRELTVTWPGGATVLDGISLSLAPGEMVGIVGPSGCGKSTLCLTLAGIIPRQLAATVAGEIAFRPEPDGTQPSEIASELGIVFQDPETQLFLPRS